MCRLFKTDITCVSDSSSRPLDDVLRYFIMANVIPIHVSSAPDDSSHLRIHSSHGSEKSTNTKPIDQNLTNSVDIFIDKEPLANGKEITKSEMDLDKQVGLVNAKALFILFLWYFFSFVTLFLNKYILATIKTDAVFFGKCKFYMIQITCCPINSTIYIYMYKVLFGYFPSNELRIY